MPSHNFNTKVGESSTEATVLQPPSSSSKLPANSNTQDSISKNGSAQCGSSNPPTKKLDFVHKLYYMLSDKELTHLIWWSGSNDNEGRFAINPCPEFSKILTQFFKHSNISSFVRQLHMYGFHKVNNGNLSTSANLDSKKEGSDIWEFRHTSGMFKKGDEVSLSLIKRRQPLSAMKSSTAFHSMPSHSDIPMHHSHSLPDYRMAAAPFNPYGNQSPNSSNQRYSVPYLYPYQRNPCQMYPSTQQLPQHQPQHPSNQFPFSSAVPTHQDNSVQHQLQPYMYQGHHLLSHNQTQQQRTYSSLPQSSRPPMVQQQPSNISQTPQPYIPPNLSASSVSYYKNYPYPQAQSSTIISSTASKTSNRCQQNVEPSGMEPHKYTSASYHRGNSLVLPSIADSNINNKLQTGTRTQYNSIISSNSISPLHQPHYMLPVTNTGNNINESTITYSNSTNTSSISHLQSSLTSQYDQRNITPNPIVSTNNEMSYNPSSSSYVNNNGSNSPFSTPRYTEESKIREGSFVDPLSKDSKYEQISPLHASSVIKNKIPSNVFEPYPLRSAQKNYEGKFVRSSEPNIEKVSSSKIRNSIFVAHGHNEHSISSSVLEIPSLTSSPRTNNETYDKAGGNINAASSSIIRSMRSSILSSSSSNSSSQESSLAAGTPFSSVGSTKSIRSFGGSISSISHLLNSGTRNANHVEGNDYKKRFPAPIRNGGISSTLNQDIKQKQLLQNTEVDKNLISVSSLLGDSAPRKRHYSHSIDEPELKRKC